MQFSLVKKKREIRLFPSCLLWPYDDQENDPVSHIFLLRLSRILENLSE